MVDLLFAFRSRLYSPVVHQAGSCLVNIYCGFIRGTIYHSLGKLVIVHYKHSISFTVEANSTDTAVNVCPSHYIQLEVPGASRPP